MTDRSWRIAPEFLDFFREAGKRGRFELRSRDAAGLGDDSPNLGLLLEPLASDFRPEFRSCILRVVGRSRDGVPDLGSRRLPDRAGQFGSAVRDDLAQVTRRLCRRRSSQDGSPLDDRRPAESLGDHPHPERQEGVGAAAQDAVGEDRPGNLKARHAGSQGTHRRRQDRLDLILEVEIVQLRRHEDRPDDRRVEPGEVAGRRSLPVEMGDPPDHP